MATKKSRSSKKTTAPTMRDLGSGKSGAKTKKPKRIKSSSKLTTPFKRIKLPAKFSKFLKKLIPGFFKGAWSEIRQTTWPSRKETARLTMAVFIFSTVFAVIIALVDFLLDKIFRSLIIG